MRACAQRNGEARFNTFNAGTRWLLTAAAAYLTMMLALVFTGLKDQRQQALNWTLTVLNLLRALAMTLKAIADTLQANQR